MSYRRFILIAFAAFMAYMLFIAVGMNTPSSASTIWPLVVGLLVILMLPEKRLGGKMIVDLVKSIKGGGD